MIQSSQINKAAAAGATNTHYRLTSERDNLSMASAILTSAAPRVNRAPVLPWFSPRTEGTTAARIERAATRYEQKYQRRPTVCYMNADDFDGTLHPTVRAELTD